MRCQVAQCDSGLATFTYRALAEQHAHVQRRSEQRQRLTELGHPVVVEQEVHPPGEGVPGLESFDVDGERCVPAPAGLAARPLRTGDHRHWTGLRVREVDPALLTSLGQGRQWTPHLVFERVEAGDGEPSVGCAGQCQDGLGHLDVGVQRRTPVRYTAEHHSVDLGQLLDLGVGVDGEAFDGEPQGVDQRTECGHLVRNGAVVALDDGQPPHRPSGNRVGRAVAPVPGDAAGLCGFARCVVLERGGHHILADTEMMAGEFAEPPGDGSERAEVAAGLPRRVDCRRERVHVRVHVRGGQVVLLVPGGRRQDDVGQQRRAGHPEVQRQQQVELALGRLVPPRHVPRAALRRSLGGAQVRVGAEQVSEEVLVALRARAEQVRPPDRQHPRPVLRRVRVFAGVPELARAQLCCDMLLRVGAGGRGLVGEVQRTAVELRVGRHPAQPGRAGDRVRGVHTGEKTLGQRRLERVGLVAVVAPLVGVGVPVRGTDHLPRRALPVDRHRHRRPSGERTALLLANVMRPAAAVAAHAPGKHQQREYRPVDQVAVEPVVDPGTHDHHGSAAGILGVLGELARNSSHLVGFDRGDLLLPGRCVRLSRIVVAGRPLSGQAVPRDAVLGQHQVEHRRDQPAGDLAGRDTAVQHLGTGRSVEPGEQHLGRGAGRIAVQAESRPDALQVEVPASGLGLGVAEADRSVRHRRLTCVLVEQDRFPLRILGFVAEIGRGEEFAWNVRAVPLAQGHEERQVGVLADVVGEERHLPVDEELSQDHMAHGHRQRRVGAGLGRQPLVGELRVVRVVRRHDDDLLAPVACLGHPVRVRGPGDRNVRTPHDQVGGVPPVTRLRHVGLVAEHLRRGDRQVGVPVVERRHRAADQLDEPAAGRVRDHRHRRDRREPGDPVGTVRLDRVNVCGGDDFGRLVPAHPDQAALAARLLVAPAAIGIGLDVGPRLDRIAEPGLGLAIHFDQQAADVGVAHPSG